MDPSKNDVEKSGINYFNLINNILDVVVELSLDFGIKYINPQIFNLAGYHPDEVVGRNSMEFVHPDDRQEVIKAITEGIKTGEIISILFRIQHKEGFFIPVFARGHRVEYENQTRIISTLRDISNELNKEQKLKKSDERYREIIENIKDGYFEIDLHGNYTYVNDYISEYLNVSKDEIIGKNYTLFLEKSSQKEVFKSFNDVYKNNLQKGTFQSRIIRGDGENRIFEGYFYLRYNNDGEKIGFYGFTRDITKRKEAEEKIKESEQKYREAYNRAELYKDLFYHDINNLLSNISIAIDLSEEYLNKSSKEENVKQFYNVIRDQFARGKRLISNVKNLSELEGYKTSLKSVNAFEILKEAIKYIHNSIHTKKVNIFVDSFDKELYINANELLLDVFENILINAVKYNENQTIEILVRISRENNLNKNFLKFEFMDNGIGITNQNKDIIFIERFNKDKGSKGMGIGLTLVKKILDNYSGEIKVEDRVKGDYTKGSNFIILIPEIAK
ncbi:MAG: PAS domain S-box protein [Promethearchaeota archaeon]